MADITITEGDTLEVDYSLENTGDGTGTFDPRLLVEGVQEDQDTGITLDPAQTATGTLQWPTESGDAVTDALAEAVTDDTSDSITVTVESAIPDSGVSRWTFNDADINSGTLVDVWGTNDGTIEGMTTTTGIYPYDSGQAGDFDGVDGRVLFGQIPELSNVSEFSLAVWVNLDAIDVGSEQILIGAYPNTDNGIRFAELNGQLRGLVENNTTRAFADGGSISTNTTELCVLTYGSQTVTGYIGGSEVLSASGGPPTTASLDIFAAYSTRDDLYTDGRLDEGRLYDKELTAQEVQNLNNTGDIRG